MWWRAERTTVTQFGYLVPFGDGTYLSIKEIGRSSTAGHPGLRRGEQQIPPPSFDYGVMQPESLLYWGATEEGLSNLRNQERSPAILIVDALLVVGTEPDPPGVAKTVCFNRWRDSLPALGRTSVSSVPGKWP